MWSKALLKAWSRTQPLIVLSSGESELAAVTKAAAEALGIQSVLSDFGVSVKIEIHSVATAAIGICKRQGLGRVRHLATVDLWVQQRVANDEFTVKKIPRAVNTGDFMTHHADSNNQVLKFMSMMSYEKKSGSSKSELRLANDILSVSAFDLFQELEPRWYQVSEPG